MTAQQTGWRRLTPAAIEARGYAVEAERSISRKELATCARDAGKALELRPALRLVLAELVGCFGEILIEDRIMVWPSNQYLAQRTGYSERAVRYAIQEMIGLQLITVKESANGKRYARKDQAGAIVAAFGFDLTPLYARRGEWAELIARQRIARARLMEAYDEITVCRRSAEAVLAELEDAALTQRLAELARRTPRRGSRLDPQILADWRDLRKAVEEAYLQAANGGNSCRQKETNNGTSSETCNNGFPGKAEAGAPEERKDVPVSPDLVLEACPALADYPHPIRTPLDLVSAASYLRPSLGASEAAWKEALELLGPIRAALVLILVLQLYDDDVSSGTHRIRNAGGYFRALSRKVAERQFDLMTELLAMRRRREAK